MDIVKQIDAILDRATQDFDGRGEILLKAKKEIIDLRGKLHDAIEWENRHGYDDHPGLPW